MELRKKYIFYINDDNKRILDEEEYLDIFGIGYYLMLNQLNYHFDNYAQRQILKEIVDLLETPGTDEYTNFVGSLRQWLIKLGGYIDVREDL